MIASLLVQPQKPDIRQDFIPLPEDVTIPIEEGENGCHWLDGAIEFGRQESPGSFDGYFEAGALWLLSSVAARRIFMQFGATRTLYTNLYIAQFGLSTVYRKSTAANAYIELAQRAGTSELFLTSRVTPQKFTVNMTIPEEIEGQASITDLTNKYRFAAQNGWYMDEFGRRLATMTRSNSVYAELYEMLLEFYNTPKIYDNDTLSRGYEKVEFPYLTILGNITPANLSPILKKSPELWGDGFLPRFIFYAPAANEPIKRGRFGQSSHIPDVLVTTLSQWHQTLGMPKVRFLDKVDEKGNTTGYTVDYTPPPAQRMTMSGQVRDAYYSYNHALLDIAHSQTIADPSWPLLPSYGRFHDGALKCAMLFASVSGSSVVEWAHWAKAQNIAEGWRVSLHNVFEQVSAPVANDEAAKRDKVYQKVIQIQQNGEMVTASVVHTKIRSLSVTEITEHLEALVNNGMIRKDEHHPEMGRPTVRYFV